MGAGLTTTIQSTAAAARAWKPGQDAAQTLGVALELFGAIDKRFAAYLEDAWDIGQIIFAGLGIIAVPENFVEEGITIFQSVVNLTTRKRKR